MTEDDLLSSILAELEADPFYQTPKSGNFTPTLVVGLGGTGTRVLRQLKGYLGAQRANRVRLFGIDSDKAENDRFAMPPLNDSEHCLLDPKRAVAWLDRYDAGDPDYQWLSGLLEETGPENSIEAEIRQKVQAGVGCGQRRRAGRLMFCSNISGGANVRNRFNKLHQELRSLRSELQRIHRGFTVDEGTRVFVVTSLAGGTGAGIVMDTLALLRSVFDGTNDDITLIGLLPGCALDPKLTDTKSEKGFTRGNAIGVLRELDGLRRPGHKRIFQFGAHDRVEWDSSRQHIATNVYLVDNECGVRGGAPVTDWDQLIAATGFFLYNFLENGVGASAFSGEVNYAPDKNYEGDRGAVYRAFGISAVRYPVDGLIRMRLFLKAGEYLAEAIKTPKGCVGQANELVKQTLNTLGLVKSEDFSAYFNDLQIDEAAFKQTKKQWKTIKWASDDDLIEAGHTAIRDLKDGLPSYDGAFDERVRETMAKLSASVEMRALELLSGNHAVVREHYARLLNRLKSWETELFDQLDSLRNKLETAEQEIARLEQMIHRLDFFLDFKHRAAYRRKIQSYLSDLAKEYRLGKARSVVVAVTRTVRRAQDKSLEIFEELKGRRLAYRSYADRYGELLGQGLFVQSGMDREAIGEWLDGLDAKVEPVPATALTTLGVLFPLFLPLVKAMRDSLKNRDIVIDGIKKGDTPLKRRLKGANEASRPLIALKSTAPDEEDLTPQRYVLAVSAETKEKELAKLFPGVGDNETKMQPLNSDYGTVACLSTVVGFKIADLKRFDEFYANYAGHPWIFHTDERHSDLPALDPRMSAENHKYRIFGLGLFLEALESRGSNYYVNLLRMNREGQAEFQYIVFSKERNPYASALKEHEIVAEAPKSQSRARSEDRIDNSLEGALDKLASEEYARFSSLIEDVWESYVNTIGKASAKEQLERFAEETIDAMVGRTKSQTERREALKRVYQALLEVADGIE
ncbi:MAG: tubulin-like doman-containing protein [Opitutales bacterium]